MEKFFFLILVWTYFTAVACSQRSIANSIQRNFIGLANKGKADIVILLDRAGTSNSCNRRMHGYMKNFGTNLIGLLPVSNGNAKVAVVNYAACIKVSYSFTRSQSALSIKNAIRRIRFKGGRRATGGALEKAIQLLFGRRSGGRSGATKIVLILTTGQNSVGPSVTTPVRLLRQKGAHIFVLGVGPYASNRELRRLGNPAISNHAWLVRNPKYLSPIIKLLTTVKPKPQPKPVKCKGSGTTYDRCGRRCKCVNGKLVRCCRVRKDLTSMSVRDRKKFIKAFKTISMKQPYKARYDALVKLHKDLFATIIHQMQEFLPWHRWYLIQMENLLLEVDCTVTMPYWDWSLWSHDPWNTNHLWRSTDDGLGGNGVRSAGYCVKTGPFAEGKWKVAPSAGSTCLKRDFTGSTPDAFAAVLINDIKPIHFKVYEVALRVDLHDTVHCRFTSDKGQMCSDNSASTPEFNLHHAFTDKLWADWQKKSTAHKKAFFTSRNIKMRRTPYYPRQLLDVMSLPNNVRICYDDPTHDGGAKLLTKLRNMSVKDIFKKSRKRFTGLSETALTIFKVSKKDAKLAAKLEKKIEPARGKTIGNSGLSQEEKVLGFKTTTT